MKAKTLYIKNFHLRNYCKSLLWFTFIFLFGINNNKSYANNDSLKIEILLTNKILESAGLSDVLIGEMSMTRSNLLVLSTKKQLYLCGWGGLKKLGSQDIGEIRSLAMNQQGGLMIIRNNELCYLDSVDNLTKFLTLPSNNFKISSGKYCMYLYESGINETNKYSIYILLHGYKYKKLIDLSQPVNTLIEFKNSIYFTNENKIFCYSYETNSIKAIVALPTSNNIRSIAIDSINNQLFISTDKSIYTYKENKLYVFSDKLSGTLMFYENSLIVFDPMTNRLLRILGINNLLSYYNQSEQEAPLSPATSNDNKINNATSVSTTTTQTQAPAPVTATTSVSNPVTKPVIKETQPTKEIITNASIIKMAKAKLSDDLIIDVIKSSEVNFDLKVESMVNLSNNGVSSAVIKEMKAAMEKKKQ